MHLNCSLVVFKKDPMKKHLIFLLFVTVCFSLCLITIGAQTSRGMKTITVHTKEGKAIELYKDSYALVVGNGNYANGWDPLEGALQDVQEVAATLEKHGFNVTLKTNLTKAKFDRAFAEFVLNSGKDAKNRLLFYYAGHGYTRESAAGEDLGYLVMVDAPAPGEDEVGFEVESIDMESLVTQAEKILARHALFVFDSCFSGTILNARDQLNHPESISDSVRYPVRQFITAGRAGEIVPDYSDFKQAFLDLLEGRAREPFPDGYITGEELGFYLKNQVPMYNSAQHPQYGKIRNPKLDKGDFVFVLPKEEAWTPPPTDLATVATLTVTSTPSGATVYVDGMQIGKTPLQGHQIDTGVHRVKQVEVRLSLSGYQSRVSKLTLKGGQKMPWAVRLEKLVSQTATLTVTSTPSGASVYVDNARIGKTPLTGYKVDTGVQREKQVEVGLSLSGYNNRVARLTLKGGQEEVWQAGRLEKLVSQTATLTVTSTPSGASVYIDSDFIGSTPLRNYEIDTGTQREKQVEVGLELSGYQSRVSKLTLKGGQKMPWAVRLEKAPTPPSGANLDGMVLIPAGEFRMGSNYGKSDERPVHTVYVDAFYMDIYEVTNAQYKQFADANPEWGKDRIPSSYHGGDYLKHWNGNSYPSGKGNHPVVYVSWYGAMAYAQWAGKRLPTEAEWEKAARGRMVGQKYPWGDRLDSNKANYYEKVGDTTPVGSYPPNGYGLYDMVGNVWEWCLDAYYADFYKNSPRRNPIAGADSVVQVINNFTNVKFRVLRGGSWGYFPRHLRVAGRGGLYPSFTYFVSGFRCARALTP